MSATTEANDAIRHAFALTTAIANNDNEVANELIAECDFQVALAVSHTALRYSLDQADKRWPGFRDDVLTFMGVAFAEDVYEPGELDT